MTNQSIRQSFADTLLRLAQLDKKIYVVSVDLKSSLCLEKFAQKFPRRFIECGVSETNAAGISAGLAKTGKTVFLTSFSCFSPAINWATIKQSICYNHANVKIIGSHSGLLSGDLGATHQMLEDVAIMRALPNMQVFAPLDGVEMKQMLLTVSRSPLPAYIRLVRPATPVFSDHRSSFTIGKSTVLKHGQDVTVLGYGPTLAVAFNHHPHSLEIINCSSIKPLDSDTILKSVAKTGRCLVIEDHQLNGGLGEAVASLVLQAGVNCRFDHLGVDNSFGQSGTPPELYNHYNFDSSSFDEAVENLCQN